MAKKSTDPLILERDARILALRGTMGVKEIARELRTTKGVVSGVCFRADRPDYRPPRRSKVPTIRLSTPLTPELHAEAVQLAADRNLSLSELNRTLLSNEVAKARAARELGANT